MSAGKGDRDRTADLNAYRSSPLWNNLSKQHNSLSEFSDNSNVIIKNFDSVESNEKYLFLDDYREVRDAYINNDRLVTISGVPEYKWDTVRSYDEFVNYIRSCKNKPTISFDFDLDTDEDNEFTDWRDSKIKTGAHCAEWLINECFWNKEDLLKCYIHSTNSKGRLIIDEILKQLIKN
jgi:hypothetical protein